MKFTKLHTIPMRQLKVRPGFTIVELLIVIVVIGILAAIVIVAYSGIQNRANDSALQLDMKSWATQMEMFYAVQGRYPTSADLPTLNLKASKGSYDTSNNAFLYCADAASLTYGIVAKSKSKTSFTVSNTAPTVATYTAMGFPQGMATICPSVGSSSASAAWIHDAGRSPQWMTWVSG